MADIVAALDADVLVPILACDFLLTAFDHGLYEPVVSETVLGEVERTLRRDFPKLDGAAIAYRVDAMRDVLADHLIEPDIADPPTAVNVKDQHVVAAAVAGEASVVVTLVSKRTSPAVTRDELIDQLAPILPTLTADLTGRFR